MDLSKQKQTEAKKLNVTAQYLIMADLMAVGYSENDAYTIAYSENDTLSVQQNNSIRKNILDSVKFKKLLENRRSRLKEGTATPILLEEVELSDPVASLLYDIAYIVIKLVFQGMVYILYHFFLFLRLYGCVVIRLYGYCFYIGYNRITAKTARHICPDSTRRAQRSMSASSALCSGSYVFLSEAPKVQANTW